MGLPRRGRGPANDLDDATRHAESARAGRPATTRTPSASRGCSSDKPGVDVSEREVAAEVAPAEDAEDEREIGGSGTT